MKLEFAEGLSLPVDAATQTFGFLARKRGGKSYAAGKLVEGLYERQVQFIVVDPVGNWFGLRLAADGKKPGLDVPVLGGLRGDIPLSPDSGKLIADTIVETGRSFVLDVSQFSLGERKRFVTALGEQLWQKQKGLKDPAPIHVVLEEAQLFLPQQPMPDERHMLGIWTEIVRLGGNKGIGVSLISQRPQSVAKEALTQVECLVVLQVNGVPEKKALKEWIVEKGLDTNLLEELPFLKQGTAFIWSPQWLEHFGKHQIKSKWTFDAGATPKVGARRVQTELKPIDLAALKDQMAETVKKLEENDPTALKRRVRELEKKLGDAGSASASTKTELKEVPVLRQQELRLLDKHLTLAAKIIDRLSQSTQVIATEMNNFKTQLSKFTPSKLNGRTTPPTVMDPRRNGAQREHPVRNREVPHREVLAGSSAPAEGSIGKGPHKVLVAIAQHVEGVTREQVSILAAYKRSTRDAYLQRLIGAGLVEERGDALFATQAGVDALGSNYEPLPTGDALREHWLRRLPDGERRILEVISNAYPGSLAREDIGESTGYKRSTRDAYLQRLGKRRLVTTVGQEVAASNVLFS